MAAWDSTNQKMINTGRGVKIEFTKISFSTTDLTVEVPTRLGKIKSINFGFNAAPNGYESLYTDGVISSNGITVGRVVTPIILSAVADDAVHVSGNDWADVPVGYCPVAGTLTRFTLYELTSAGGGPPVIKLGDIVAAGTKDIDSQIAAGNNPAGDAKHVTITSFDGVNAGAVAAGDLLIFGTASGGVSAPSGAFVQAEYNPTPTSGLEIWVEVVGW